MRNFNQYDEKQIYDREKCFQISFFVALACVFISFFVIDVLEIKISAYITFCFCIWIPISVCCVLMILKNAYDGIKGNYGKTVAIVLFICGIFIIASRVIILIVDNGSLVYAEEIENLIATMIQAVSMILIGVVYFIKQYLNKRNFDEEE